MRVLIDFHADWCAPCKGMKPILKEISKEYTVLEVDVDKEPEKVTQYGVLSVPTYIVMDGNEEIRRFIGATSKEEIEQSLRL